MIGGRWLSVSVYGLRMKPKEGWTTPRVDRFCEALKLATIDKVLLYPETFTCPGALYSFGYGQDLVDHMIRKLIDTREYSPECAQQLIEQTPHYTNGVQSIGINVSSKPDVLVAQLQPAQVMRLVRIYQKNLGKMIQIQISSVISACGNVVVKAIHTQSLAISFGCDDSREFGAISRDRLYVGLPYMQAVKLTDRASRISAAAVDRSTDQYGRL